MAFPLRPLYNAANCDDNEGGGDKLEKKGEERKLGVREKGDVSWDPVFLEDRRFNG